MGEAVEGLKAIDNPFDLEVGALRLSVGRKRDLPEDLVKLDVYDTADNLGIFKHRDEASEHELRRFFPLLLDGMLQLEEDVFEQLQAMETPQAGVDRSDREGASEEFIAFQKLVSALSRVLYYPSENNGQDTAPQDIDPKKAARKKEIAQWFFKRNNNNFDTESAILAYPQKGAQPRRISPHDYDFREPAVMKLTVTEQHSKERLSIEIFPVASYQYPGKFSSLGTVPPEQARRVLAERRVNPELIQEVVAAGEASTTKPQMRLRLEGRDGRPISQAVGSLMRNREGTDVGLYLQYEGPENSKLAERTSAMQKREELFVPLPGLQKVQNAPLASFGQAILGLKLKDRMDVTKAKQPVGKRSLAIAGRRSA